MSDPTTTLRKELAWEVIPTFPSSVQLTAIAKYLFTTPSYYLAQESGKEFLAALEKVIIDWFAISVKNHASEDIQRNLEGAANELSQVNSISETTPDALENQVFWRAIRAAAMHLTFTATLLDDHSAMMDASISLNDTSIVIASPQTDQETLEFMHFLIYALNRITEFRAKLHELRSIFSGQQDDSYRVRQLEDLPIVIDRISEYSSSTAQFGQEFPRKIESAIEAFSKLLVSTFSKDWFPNDIDKILDKTTDIESLLNELLNAFKVYSKDREFPKGIKDRLASIVNALLVGDPLTDAPPPTSLPPTPPPPPPEGTKKKKKS